jgi:carboxypeptidase T
MNSMYTPQEPVAYSNVLQIESALVDLAASCPDFIQRFQLPNRTWEGRICNFVRIGDRRSNPNDRTSIYLTAGLHAREVLPPEILIYLGRALMYAYAENDGLSLGGESFDPDEIQGIVRNLDLMMFPMVNPDGRNYVMRTYPLWRKNRRTDGLPNDPDCVGVDVNRNFDFLWDFPEYFFPACVATTLMSSRSPCRSQPKSDVYIGPSAASEPETRNVVWFLQQSRNLARPSYLVDVHQYGPLVLYSWGDAQLQVDDPKKNFQNATYNLRRGDAFYREYIQESHLIHLQGLAGSIQTGISNAGGEYYDVKPEVAMYPASGLLSDFAFSRSYVDPSLQPTFSLTIECGNAVDHFWPLFPRAARICEQVAAGILRMLHFIVTKDL